jgi:hypothetical protein
MADSARIATSLPASPATRVKALRLGLDSRLGEPRPHEPDGVGSHWRRKRLVTPTSSEGSG